MQLIYKNEIPSVEGLDQALSFAGVADRMSDSVMPAR
jgi:hypothetical protein